MFVLITGGSGSGKSEYAENRAVELANGEKGLFYIATMYPFDRESRARIARHRTQREGKHFVTIERYTGLKELTLPSGGVALLECMSNLTANEMYQPEGAGEEAVEEIWQGIESLQRQCAHLLVVTNEIFSDGADYDEETRRCQRCLGEINCRMAGKAREVVEVVYGIALHHKGGCGA